MDPHRRWVEALLCLLIPAYVAQALMGCAWGPLGSWQDDPRYRLGSGVALAMAVAWLWLQGLARSIVLPKPWIALGLHRIGGLAAIVALFAHTTRFGHAYLTGLAIVFLATLLIGAASPAALRLRAPLYQRIWLFLHIVFAVLVVVGIAFHLWIGLSYA